MAKEVVNIPYNEVGFNRDWVRSFDTAEAFIAAAEPHIFKGERSRSEWLADVWDLAQGTPKNLEKLQQESGGDLQIAVQEMKEAEESPTPKGKKAKG
jgi:hypothetical protein